MKTELKKITGKKLLTVLLAAVMALSLAACDKADNNSGSNAESSGESSFSSTVNGTSSAEQSAPVRGDTPSVPAAGTGLKLLALNYYKFKFYFGNAYATEDGLYYLKDVDPGGFNLYGNLMYIDYATRQETYLCSDSSCKHGSERCASYMANSDLYATNGNSRMFVYNNSLYYLSIAYYNSNSSPNHMPEQPRMEQTLYRMDPDGSNRELVFTFNKGVAIEPFAVGDGNAVWFLVETPTVEYDEENEVYFTGVKDRSLIKVDLSDFNIVEQIPINRYTDLTSVRVLDCSDSRVIFYGWDGSAKDSFVPFDSGAEEHAQMYEKDKKTNSVYFMVDLTNKEVKEIFRHGHSEKYNVFANGEYAYFTNTEELSTIRVNLDNCEQSEFFPAEGYVAVGKVGGKFECRSVDNNDSTVYFIDMANGEITSSAVKSYCEPEETIMSDAMAFGKDYVLIRTNETISEEHGRHIIYDYAVISLDDFFNGRENYEPVKMIRMGVEAKYDENRT